MACPWLLLNNLFLIYGAGCDHEFCEHKPLYELYPSNSNTPHGTTGKDNTHAHTGAGSSSSRLSPATLEELATLPCFRTIVVRNVSSTQTPVLGNLKMLYLELGQFDVEYIARFGDISPIFVVCSSPKVAELVLQFLPGMMTRDSKEGFVGEIYDLSLIESFNKIEAWPYVSLWVSIEEKDLRLRVRAVDDPFRGFQDLSWQFQRDCHHRSGENDHDKEGEVTLWVETSGIRKDFTMPPGKGRQLGRIQSNMGTQRIDGAIETIQSGIQNQLSEGRVVVGLQLVFMNAQDSKELKRWLVGSSVIRDDGNDEDDLEFEYPPAFQVSAMRRSQIPVPPPPSWSPPFIVDNQTKLGPDHVYDSTGGDNSQKANQPSHEDSCQYYCSEMA